MNLNQALEQTTSFRRSKTYVIKGKPDYLAAELDHLEARHGDQTISDLIAWNEREPMPRDNQNVQMEEEEEEKEIRHECDSQCVNLVYERDTGLSWCRIDEEPETCQPYSRQDAKNDAKNRWNERY